MPLSMQEVIFTCTNIVQLLENNESRLAFEKCAKLWNTTIDINDIFSENIFKKTIASTFNQFDNEPLLSFILEKASDYLKDDYPHFLLSLHDFIFKDAIAVGHLKNLEHFKPDNFFPEQCLKISIKYGSWSSFIYIVDNYIDKEKQTSIINWSQKQFWDYAVNGYANSDFIKELLAHPASINRPVKKPIYDLINDSNFDFINDLITSEHGISLLKNINAHHYYTLLFKKIADKKNDVYYKQSGMTLLQNSYQLIDFDFSTLSFSPKFIKDNVDIVSLLNKFILKDTLELLPYKIIKKTLKI